MKTCTKCNTMKPLEEYHRCSQGLDGRMWQCKICACLTNKEYRERNKEKVALKNSQYRKNPTDPEYHSKYWKKNRERLAEYQREYQKKNPERFKEYRKKNAEYFRIKTKEYREKNKEEVRNRYNKRRRERQKEDVLYRLRVNLRQRIRQILKRGSKKGSAIKDVGCTFNELKSYIESKFQPGMSWDNYGYRGWHIDHIIPLSRFDLSKREEFLKAVHYTNLQPLWAIDNIRKGNKIL